MYFDGACKDMTERDVIIIGAGPSGLALAVSLQAQSIPFRILDKKACAGGAYNDIYANMRLASPARYVSLPGLPLQHDKEYIQAGEYISYLKRYAQHFELRIEAAEVKRLTQKFRPDASLSEFSLDYRRPLEADPGGGEVLPSHAYQVVLASGMFDSPRYSAEVAQARGGDGPCIIHAHDWRGVDEWLGKRVLLVGSSTSAVEIAETFADAGQLILVSSRHRRFNSIPQRLLGRDIHDLLVPLAKLPTWLLTHHCRHYYENDEHPVSEPATHETLRRFLDKGLIRLTAAIESISGKRVYFKNGDSDEFDVIICATGYRFDYSYIQAGASQASLLSSFKRGESRLWPGLYRMGKACVFGRPSQFIWGIAHDAPLMAELITQRWRRIWKNPS